MNTDKVDDQNQFDRDARKGIWTILILMGVGVVIQNLTLYLTNPDKVVVMYPIWRFVEIGVLSFLLWKKLLSDQLIQYGVVFVIIEIIFQRLIISPVPYISETTVAALVCMMLISPGKNAFRVVCVIFSVLFICSLGLKTIDIEVTKLVTILLSYLIIYLIGMEYIRMQESYASFVFKQITDSPKYKNVKIAKSEFKEIEDKIQGFLGGEEKFLHSDYTVKSLADDIGVPRTMVSKVLSMGMNTSFSQLLNEYRIDEVKKRLKDPSFSDEKIISIAYDCGFSSKSTFNTLFKKHTGQTPREYRDS